MAWIVGLDQQVRRWSRLQVSGDGVRLLEGRDAEPQVEQLLRSVGGRVGIEGVLADLDRLAVVTEPPADAATYGFCWNDDDVADRRWWPQGITTSADANDTAQIGGREVVVVAWYAKRERGRTPGARLTFVDVTDRSAPRYRHVLLVEPRRDRLTRRVSTRPVPVHAGGIVWYGSSILVADTRGGFRTFMVDDLCRAAPGRGPDGHGDGKHHYLLPQRSSYRAVNDRGFLPVNFSFVSLDRSGADHQLIAGEYGRGNASPRLIRFGLDPTRLSLATTDGVARPLEVLTGQPTHMQGATMVDGTTYVSTSRGESTPGSLWVRRAGENAREHRGVLAIGPEDLSYWPQHDELWNCSEYPGRRYVYALPRARFG
ncbi:MAG: hypothetical protein AVDCRST_MAG21-1254 [uncultured Nocardioidaceae bacterium]|uniref:Secreted protein n=1 Tax=uncultured Nocardioidaceae bacterium TaxID=253824 RepID=A0A6J4MZS8_9ACTN|nr:MAG: hypothetical protein AVDCRST_MAG21-1254 [uncultured Nocardioidaceae bacterium]